jgi:hypothetical protein
MEKFFKLHDKILLDINKSYSDNIRLYNYKENIHYSILYEENNDKLIIKGINYYGLNLIRKYYYFVNKKILRETFIELSNNFKKFLKFLRDKIIDDNYLSKCCICDDELYIKDKIIKCCNNIECLKKYKLIVSNDIIKNSFKDYLSFDFLFEAFSASFHHNKYKEALKDNIIIIENVNNVIDMKNIVPDFIIKNDKKELYNKIIESNNDIEIYEKVGYIVYGIIKNILSNNYFELQTTTYNYQKRRFDNKNKEPKILNIEYSSIKENNLENNNVLFHGSSICSWYCIIKNGLRNLSGTTLMANGQVYGKGIYLSDNLSFAGSYSRSFKNYQSVIGVFMINDEINKYKKSNNIYVVEDSSKLVLKSLVFLNSNSNINDIQSLIINHFKNINNISMNNEIKDKRLKNEMKQLTKNKFILDIKIINDKEWNISFKNNKEVLNSKFIFNKYPINPPSIILEKEYKQIKVNEVSDNKIISLNMLNQSEWFVGIKLVDIIENIIEITN